MYVIDLLIFPTNYFIFSMDEPLIMIDGETKYYYHFNQLGSVTALTDINGAAVERYSYDAYGEPTVYDDEGHRIPASVPATALLAIGSYILVANGTTEWRLYHYRARAYEPVSGRFLQREPHWRGVNLYSYALENPLLFRDPQGTEPKIVEFRYRVAHDPSNPNVAFPMRLTSEQHRQ